MYKKKRLFGLFAIMFVAIFSVGCVFATACKKNKESDEESEPEHVHAYTKLKYDNEYHWYECATDDGAVDESTKVKHEFDNGTVTTAATCGAAGVTTYKCACGYSYTEAEPAATGEHTYDKAVFEWAEDYSSATASLVCSVCGDAKYTGVEATVTSTSDDEKTTYTAKVTFEDGTEKTDIVEVPVEKVPEPVGYTQKNTYDFNDGDTYAYFITVNDDNTIGSSDADTEFNSGIFTYKAIQISENTASKILSVTVDGTAVNAMTTGAKSTSNHAYIELDFSEYAGENVKIETTFSSNKGDGTEDRSMYVSTKACDPVNTSDKSCLLKDATSSTQTDLVTLTYEDVIGNTNSKLYLLCSANVCIFSITVSLTGETDPWGNGGATTPETHTHTYENATPTWTWAEDADSTTGYTATATIVCTDEACPDADKGALKASADATVGDTTESTCTQAGSVSLSATVTLNGTPYPGTGSVALPLADHTYPTQSDTDYDSLVVWGWKDLGESTETVTLTVKCSTCKTEELINQDVSYTSQPNTDGSVTLTASYTVSGTLITYTDTYTVPVPEIELADRVVAIPQGEEIPYQASDAEASANFSNASAIGVTFDETTSTFTLSGTASTMSEEQAAAFWPGTAQEDDAYVIIGVYSNVGETITFTSSDKEKSFTKTNYEDDLAVIIRITDTNGSVTFRVTDNESQQEKATFTVSFAGIDIPQKADSAESIQDMIDAAAQEASETGSNASVNITLTGEISGSITIKTGTDVTLDLAGFAITGNSAVDGETGTTYTIIVEEGATLTITNSTGDGSVKCTYAATNNENSRLGAAVYVNGGDLVIEGGEIDSTSVGVLAEAGTVTMTGGKISSTYYTLWLARGEVTAYVGGDAVMTGERGIFVAGDCKYGYGDYSADEDCVTKLYVYGNAEITTTFGSAISTLGLSNKETVYVYIYGGTINGRAVEYDEGSTEETTVMPAIYMPNGKLYIYGGTISGTTAVEMRGGTLVIEGGTLVSTAGTQYTNYNSTGASTYGYALAVYPYLITVRDNEEGFDNSLSVTVTGGTFTGKIFNWSVDKGEGQADYEYEFSITGGLFSEDPSAYLDEGYKATLSSVTGYEGYYEVYEYYITNVTISEEALSLEYDENSTEKPSQAEISLTINMSDDSAFAGTVEWTSSDETVVTVDGTGASATITVVGAGTATITATVAGWDTPLTCEVTVAVAADPVEGDWKGTASFALTYKMVIIAGLVELDVNVTLYTDIAIHVANGEFELEIDSVYAEDGNTEAAVVETILNALLEEYGIYLKSSYEKNGSNYTVHINDEDFGTFDVTATYGTEGGCEYLSVSFEMTMDLESLGEATITVTDQKVWKDGNAPEERKETTIEYDFTDTEWTDTLADQFAYTSDEGYITEYRPSDEISYDDDGILKSVDVPREKTSSETVTGSEYKSSIDGGFKTGEKTQKKDSLSTENDDTQVFTGYMMLDLSSFAEATSVTISIEFKTESTGDSGGDRTVALVSALDVWNNYASGSGLAEATSGKNDTENTTLTYTVNFDALGEDDIIYIIWSENIKIYNITITVVE